jgi:hypothetical protein
MGSVNLGLEMITFGTLQIIDRYFSFDFLP